MLSPRLQIFYPDEGTDPWFDAFKSFVEDIDATLYANREDRNILVFSTGRISFDNDSGLVSWTAPIQIVSPVSGYLLTIQPGEISVADGQILYAMVPRGLTSNGSASITASNGVPSDNNSFVLAVRIGSNLYLRSGLQLLNDPDAKISGLAMFDGTQDYVDVLFPAPFTSVDYGHSLSVAIYDSTASVVAFLRNKSVSGFRVSVTPRFSGEVCWRAFPI